MKEPHFTLKKAVSRALTPENWAGLFALFLMSAFILWVPETGYSSIVGPKHNLFLLSCAVFFPVLLGLMLRKREKPKKGQLICLALAGGLLILFLLSSVLSQYQDTVWLGARRHEGFLTLALYLLLFSAMALWGKVGRAHFIVISLTSILVFALAAMQFAGKNPLNLYPNDLTFHDRNLRYSGEYLSTIGNSDLLSAFLTMAFLFQAGAYAAGKAKAWILPGAFCAWMCLLLSEVTAGPVAILGCLAICLIPCLRYGIGVKAVGDIAFLLLLGLLCKSMLGYRYADGSLTFFLRFGALQIGLLVCTLLMLIPGRLLRDKAHPRAAMVLALSYVGLFLAGYLFLFFYRGSNEKLQALHLLARFDPPDTLGSSRIRIWKEALTLGKEMPLLGSGPDTYRFRSTIIFTSTTGTYRQTSVDVAHSEYLNLWVNTGLPSMLLFMGLIGCAVIPALHKPNRSTLPLLLPALGYAIHALFGISQSVVSPLFYLFLGALVYACNRDNHF